MSPKEYALELIEKFMSLSGHRRFSIGYAIICVEEQIKTLEKYKTTALILKFELIFLRSTLDVLLIMK